MHTWTRKTKFFVMHTCSSASEVTTLWHYINTFTIIIIITSRRCSDTHTYTNTQLFNGLLSGTTRVGRHQKKHSPTHTHPNHYQLPLSSAIYSIVLVQFTRLTVLFYNISPDCNINNSFTVTVTSSSRDVPILRLASSFDLRSTLDLAGSLSNLHTYRQS